MRFPSPLLLAASLLSLAGCTLAPRYQRPASPVPPQFSASPEEAGKGGSAVPAANSGSAADLGWREFFTDPRLQELIGLALRNNRDLRVAALNVEAVAAQYRIQRSALLPTVDVDAGLQQVRQPNALVYPGEPNPLSEYTLNAGIASWEVDLFGRLQSLKNQAWEQFLASRENRRSVQLGLVAQVATEYLTERAQAEEIDLAASTLKAQQDSLFITRRSYEVGTLPEQDFRTAQAQVATAQSDLAALRRQYAQTLTALAVLIGGPVPEPERKLIPLSDTGLMADLPAGLPSDLLNRRPDILQAEHVLKADNANIGAARAAFFPRITLTANDGFESLSLSKIVDSSSKAWVIDPQLVLPIFDGGSNRANLKLAETQKLSAVASYEKAIQTAFQQVSDGLTGRRLYDDQIAAQRTLVEANRVVYTLAEARYRHGIVSYLVQLEAQRDYYSAQQTLIQTRLARLLNLVTLYQNLGGGWNEHSPNPDGPHP